MKTIYSTILLLFAITLHAQTGTIKIQKPNPPAKDTVVPKRSLLHLYIEGNYTFKQNKKYGMDAGYIYFPKAAAHNILGIGLEWDLEQQYYQLSPYNLKTMQPDIAYLHSETKSSYLKAQAAFRYPMFYSFGTMKRQSKKTNEICFITGIACKYLLKTDNEHRRLSYNDFNQYNFTGYVALDIIFGKGHYSFGAKYSGDFMENLKDRNIYNEYGFAVGKITSKTQLLSFSLKYLIRYN